MAPRHDFLKVSHPFVGPLVEALQAARTVVFRACEESVGTAKAAKARYAADPTAGAAYTAAEARARDDYAVLTKIDRALRETAEAVAAQGGKL